MNDAAARPVLRALQHDLAAADDRRIARVVAVVDAMPERGRADELIAPLRGRLAALHPPRPLGFARLLFLPLDPLIVPAATWRRDAPRVPRTALAPLAAVVQSGLGERAVSLGRAIAGLTTADGEAVHRLGPGLWAAAGDILAAAPAPADWTDATGLPLADHRAIAAIAAAVLALATRIDRLAGRGGGGGHDIEELLRAALERGPGALAAITALLAERLPRADLLFAAADDLAARLGQPALRGAVDQALDAALDAIDVDLAAPRRLDEATGELRRVVARIEDLDGPCASRPGRKARLADLRRNADTASRQQFAGALDGQLLHPAERIDTAGDGEIAALEASARGLRRFESVARRLGGADHYDRVLRQAAAALRPAAGTAGAGAVDRARLIEILQGPEAAMAALAG